MLDDSALDFDSKRTSVNVIRAKGIKEVKIVRHWHNQNEELGELSLGVMALEAN